MRFKNLVIEGAAIKALPMFGIMQTLAWLDSQSKKEVQFLLKGVEHIYGTSSGAIFACFVALGMTPQEIADIAPQLQLATMLDIAEPTEGEKKIDPQHPSFRQLFQGIQSFHNAKALVTGITKNASSTLEGFLNKVGHIHAADIKPRDVVEDMRINLQNQLAALKDIGDDPKHLQEVMAELKRFLDIINGLKNLRKGIGLCKGNIFLQWLKNIIRDQIINRLGGPQHYKQALDKLEPQDKAEILPAIDAGEITFGHLNLLREKFGTDFFKNLTVTGTRISSPLKNFDFSTMNPEHAKVRVADAVRASMSIPGIFQVAQIRDTVTGHLFGLFTDGGTLRNLPLPLRGDAIDESVLNETLIIRCNAPFKEAKDLVDFPLIEYFHAQTETVQLNDFIRRHDDYQRTNILCIGTEPLSYVDFFVDQHGKLLQRLVTNAIVSTLKLLSPENPDDENLAISEAIQKIQKALTEALAKKTASADIATLMATRGDSPLRGKATATAMQPSDQKDDETLTTKPAFN